MKSDLILAFNEIAESRKLPREVVLEALSAALISAYRKDTNISTSQLVEVRFDERSGEPSIWVEREVAETVETVTTEIALDDARRLYPGAKLGDMVMVDDTPEDFGRIAAQTAKQVILQRMREAERNAQYDEFLDRVGDLVTGTVQSYSGEVATISLGRAEAILPKAQQVPGEHYKVHTKLRAYVLEVKKSPRGPQIIVSRAHRNMLQRLLEYEVPEIYNGTVEIKSIAREPGARSKVAVYATIPGADPVGACVGMRGVRIQSIVKELNGEKIDVIEWSEDPAQFISKALSPARVSAVFLDDDPIDGRTATVIVPDDQLSLAIGREGQNARLAAKLTSWRIDIKSVSEAARDAYTIALERPALVAEASITDERIAEVSQILEKKDAGRAVMPEEFHVLVDFLRTFESRRLAIRQDLHREKRAEIDAARKQVAPIAYEIPLDETDLPVSVYRALNDAGFQNAGQVLEYYYLSSEALLERASLEEADLVRIEELAAFTHEAMQEAERAREAELAAIETESIVEEMPVSAEELTAADLTEVAEEELETAEVAEAGWIDDDVSGRQQRAALADNILIDLGFETPVVTKVTETSISHDDDAAAAIDWAEALREVDFDEEEDPDAAKGGKGKPGKKDKKRQLVYDDDLGRVVAKKQRKRSASEWDIEGDEF